MERIVFVIDDDQAARESLTFLLRTEGMTSRAYASAPAFLQQLKPTQRGCIITDVRMPEMDGTFDVILMDIQMPQMNGVEASRRIRAVERAEQRMPTPILALTANVMPNQIEEYLHAGMNGCVAKPIEVGMLYAALDAAIAPPEQIQNAVAA